MYQFDNLFAALSALGIANGLLLGGYLLKKSHVSNRYLGAFLLLLSLRYGITTVSYFYRNPQNDFLVDWGLLLNLSLGPLFLAYVSDLLKQNLPKGFWVRQLWPMGFLAVLLILARTILPWGDVFTPFQTPWFALNQLTLLHWILYLVYTYRWSRSQLREGIPGLDVHGVQLWLNGLLLFMGVLVLGYSFNNAKILCVIFCPLFYTIIVYLLLAYFIKNYNLLQKAFGADLAKNNALKAEFVPQLQAQLQQFMEQEQGFRDADLNLEKLAQKMGCSSHALSHYINSYEGCNFSDWLNRYRVTYACQLLLDEQYAQLKIAAIAYDSGFNTLSVFNGAFKKVLHQTPSEFRKYPTKGIPVLNRSTIIS